ncbi:hypothetical protein AAG906_041234 [Vitis piasezkii]
MSASSSSNFSPSSQSQTCVHTNSSVTSHPPNDVPVCEEPLSIEPCPHLLHQSIPQKECSSFPTRTHPMNWSIRQLDVNNAFFHGYLLEDVCITQPPSFVHPNFLDHVYKLQKALYALKQAPRAWFPIKDLGVLHYFLGVEVLTTSHGILLTQSKCIQDFFSRTRIFDAKEVHTPLSNSSVLSLHDSANLSDVHASTHHYPLGCYQMSSSLLERYYLAWSLFTQELPLHLHAFSDADWAGNKDDRMSTSAYIVFLGHNPISWASKKQRSVARSSIKTEYEAIASIATELSWIRSLLMEITISLPQQPTIYCDNVGTTYFPLHHFLLSIPSSHRVGHLGWDVSGSCNSNTIFCGSLTATLMFEHEEGPVVKEVFLDFGLHGVSEEQIYDIAKEIGDAIGKLLALFLKIKLMTTVLEWGLHSLEWECLQEQAKQKDEDENEQ